MCQLSFNSKLVRLKEAISEVLFNARDEFQFQTGAIKSVNDDADTSALTAFQFQTGSIKSTKNGLMTTTK